MANASHNYEAFIKDLDDKCQQSIVCIQIYSKVNQNKLLDIGTGIMVVSEGHSYSIMTSSDFIKKHKKKVGSVTFFNGTVRQINLEKWVTWKEIAIIGIHNIPFHCETVKFSANQTMEGQKVFTIGYNFNKPDKRYISGNTVCGTNIIENEATLFVHGSSTGKYGHQGSAVFNEEGQLVGMNFLYTRSKDNDIGGLVSALDVQIIIRRLKRMCLKSEDNKSLDEALQFLQGYLRQDQGQSQ